MENYGNYTNYEDDEIDLGLMFRFMWKKALIIAGIGVACAILGAGFAKFKNKGTTGKYVSDTSIYCELSAMGVDPESELTAQRKIMKDYAAFATCRPVVEQVIINLGLDTDYDSMAADISAEAVEDTDILKISVGDDDPGMAQAKSEQIADETMKKIAEMSSYCKPHILEPATYPAEISFLGSKSVKKFALIGLIAGLFIGCVIYALIYICGDKILTDDDIKRFLHLNTLAVLKKDDSIDEVINKLGFEETPVIVKLGSEKSILDENIEAEQIAKSGKAVIADIPIGSHARQAAKRLERLSAAGCRVLSAVLREN